MEPPGWPAAPGVEAASLGGRVTDWTELENENDPDWERSPPDLPGADDRVSDWPDERGAKSTDRGRALAMVLSRVARGGRAPRANRPRTLPRACGAPLRFCSGRPHDANGQGGGTGRGSS